MPYRRLAVRESTGNHRQPQIGRGSESGHNRQTKRGEPKKPRKTGAVTASRVCVFLWVYNRSLQDTTDGIRAVRVWRVRAKRSVRCSTRGAHRKGIVTAFRVCMWAQPFTARHRRRHSCDSRQERVSDRSVYCSTNRSTNEHFHGEVAA